MLPETFFSLKPYTNIFFCLRQNNAKKNIITFLYRPIFREKDTIRFEFFLLYCLSLFVSRRGSKIEININLSLLLYLKLFKITTNSLNKANYSIKYIQKMLMGKYQNQCFADHDYLHDKNTFRSGLHMSLCLQYLH